MSHAVGFNQKNSTLFSQIIEVLPDIKNLKLDKSTMAILTLCSLTLKLLSIKSTAFLTFKLELTYLF